MRDKLIELIVDAENKIFCDKPHCTDTERIGRVADQLLAEGVIVLPCKMDLDEFIADNKKLQDELMVSTGEIERLTEEVAELQEKVEAYRLELGETRVALAEANEEKRKLSEEIEGLIADNSALLETMHTPHKDPEGSFRIKLNVPKGSGITYLLRSAKQIELDTMGKMADKLKACVDNSTGKLYHGYSIHRIIDRVIKEIVEETK